MIYAYYIKNTLAGLFANPQPDAVDKQGNVICPGTPTVELDDDHPDILAFLAKQEKS
jgi:hypothetical protein